MIRCRHCGTENYAIDMWCSSCSQHLDWAPPLAAAPVAEPETAPVAEPEPELAPVAEPEPEAAPIPAREPQAAPVVAFVPTPVRRPAATRRSGIWILPAAAAAILAMLLAAPVAGWFKAVGQHETTAQLPLTAALGATPPATPTPTDTPAPSAAAIPAPAQPADQPPPTQPPADLQPVPVPAFQTTVGDPTGAIDSFYRAVAAHRFDAAAATWSGQMQANYPPAEFINHRFAYTQQMNLLSVRTIANNGQTATVSIDLIEVYAGSQRHWAGTWQMVRSSSGWLLNQPNLRAAR